jgi:type I restriction-modification system DNA methylase subunit
MANNNEETLETQLWKAADMLRKNIDAAEYKHVVLGLIFLRYIADAFEALHTRLVAEQDMSADPEDRDEYRAENVFSVPPSARWGFLQSRAKTPEIGKDVDAAMDAIERDNPSLRGVLPKVYARGNLDPTNLGGLIDLISNIAMGDAKDRSADVLGHVFEYFLGEFALAEGKKGGQFYTPKSVVKLLIEMLEPYQGRVFDPQVVQAKWFGKPCINVNGKAFVVKFGPDLAFKLAGDDHRQALQIEGAKLFDPRGKGNPFKEWVQVPAAQASTWLEIAKAAKAFVSSQA